MVIKANVTVNDVIAEDEGGIIANHVKDGNLALIVTIDAKDCESLASIMAIKNQ